MLRFRPSVPQQVFGTIVLIERNLSSEPCALRPLLLVMTRWSWFAWQASPINEILDESVANYWRRKGAKRVKDADYEKRIEKIVMSKAFKKKVAKAFAEQPKIFREAPDDMTKQ